MADAAAGWMGRGLHDVKVGFGKKGDAHPGYAHACNIDFVKAPRDAIGPDPEIMVDLGVSMYSEVSTTI